MPRKKSKNNFVTEYQSERLQELKELKRRKLEAKKQKRNMENDSVIYVGVCDDYRRFCSKHAMLGDSDYVGKFDSLPIYGLWDVGQTSPLLAETGNSSVRFEVYRVSKSTLNKLDDNEYYYEHQLNRSYMVRKLIDSPFGDIFVYFLNDENAIEYNPLYEGADLITNGDWVDYKESFKYKNKKNTTTV